MWQTYDKFVKKRKALPPVALLLIFSTGCGTPSSTVSVKGLVTLDRVPVDNGYIIFNPDQGQGTPVAGPITNGNYSIAVTPGLKSVEITAQRAIPGAFASERVDGKKVAMQEQFIPDVYNSKTTLTCIITPDGAEHNFRLVSSHK